MADINTIECTINDNGFVNFNSKTPSMGQAWLTSNHPSTLEKIECVTITGLTDVPMAGRYLISGYTDCYDCQVSNYFVYSFEDCVRKAFFFEVTAESFGFSPTIDETYYFTYSVCNELITTCATLSGIGFYESQEELNSYVTNCKIGVVQETPVLQTGRNACTSCLTGNSVPHNVMRCDGETDCVLLLANTFDGYLISYSDGIDQYCGVVVEPTSCSGPYFNFIQEYGLYVDEGGSAECIDCLSASAQKIKLVNCLDPEQTEVVWSSAFYGAGDVSNLSLDNGCYEVSGYTEEEEVTIDYFFNFEPQPGCDPCVECNGVIYSYTGCSGGEDFYTLRSFQALSGGTYFYDPLNDICAQIVGTESAYVGITYSVETFDDCSDCIANADINYYEVSICTTDGTFSNLYVTTDSTVIIGNIVKLMWGSNEWVCGEIIGTADSYSEETYYNTQKNGSGTTLIYDTCENCNSQGAIGITLLSCDIPYTESFVQITLENYLQILNYGSLQNYSVSDQNGNCYTISNVCPIPLNSNGFTPVGFYFNCSICSENNPDVNPPRSANTETIICQEVCDLSGGTRTVSVTPPHPVWTDGFGTQVTQLNMVTLGGVNGLNS